MKRIPVVGIARLPYLKDELGFGVIALGNSGIGKTSLITRHIRGEYYDGNWGATIGIDHYESYWTPIDGTRYQHKLESIPRIRAKIWVRWASNPLTPAFLYPYLSFLRLGYLWTRTLQRLHTLLLCSLKNELLSPFFCC